MFILGGFMSQKKINKHTIGLTMLLIPIFLVAFPDDGLDALTLLTAPGGIYSNFIVMYNLEPIYATGLEVTFLCILLYIIFRITKGTAIFLVLVIACIPSIGITKAYIKNTITPPNFNVTEKDIEDLILNTGAEIYTFTNTSNENSLVFIGIQHVSDLEYYSEINKEINKLANENYFFFIEETSAFKAWKGSEKKVISTYNVPLLLHYTRILRQPSFSHLLNDNNSKIVDLQNNSSEIVNIKQNIPYNKWEELVHKARDKHLLKTINKLENKNLAIIYGAQHLQSLLPALRETGWEQNTAKTIPVGRERHDFFDQHLMTEG